VPGLPAHPPKLALPQQVGTGTGHHASKAEAPRQFFGFERCLPGLALDPRQSLPDQVLGSFALGQVLGLLAPVADPSQMQRQDLFSHG
jgi:hypothetical protein